jgi:aromatic ring hydroxylase
LRDGREVYIYGERVDDVTKHPAFRYAAVSVAKLYDALQDTKRKDVLTTGAAGATGSPWDYPLTSRFDENTPFSSSTTHLCPGTTCSSHRDFNRLEAFYPRSSFGNGFTMRGCTRLAVTLDWLAQSLLGADRRHGLQSRSVGERCSASKYPRVSGAR